MRVDWTNVAVAELSDISEYIERDRGIEVANRVSRRIYEAACELSRFPNLGRSGRVQDTRELVVVPTPYIVIYRVCAERVLIVNIKHGAQRWPTSRKPI